MAIYGYLAHYGVQGMKWGVRNYQNYDGSYTSAGLSRYGRHSSGGKNTYNNNKAYNNSKRTRKEESDKESSKEGKERKKLSPETKKKIIVASVAAVSVLAVTGLTIAAVKNPDAARAAVNAIGKTAVKAGQGIKTAAIGTKNMVNNARTVSKINRVVKINKALDKGNIERASKLAKKLPKAAQVQFIKSNEEALRGSLKAANNFRSILKQTDAGRDIYAKAIGATNTFNKGRDLVKGMSAFNKAVGTAGAAITAAGTVTGTIAGGKKILNDINNIYTTDSLPVVRDFLNSPRGASTKKFVDSAKNKMFGVKVEEMEDKKK